MRRAGVWIVVGAIGALLVLARAQAQSEGGAVPAPTPAPSGVPAEPITGTSSTPQGPDWVAPEAGGPIPESAPPQSATEIPPPTAATPPPAAGEADRRPAQDPAFKDWGPPGAGPPPDLGPPYQAALLLGVGGTLNDTAGSVNPLGFGFGVRGGYRILPEVVVGARFLYFIGGSSALPTGEVSMSSWQLAAEAAYVVPLTDTIDLEPGILLGMNVLTVRGPRTAFLEGEGSGFVGGSSEKTEAAIYFAPGAAIRIPIDLSPDIEGFFVGGDARLGFQFRDVVGTSIELMGQAGIRF
jgi:hypothetical protein